MGIQWSKEQKQVIELRNRNILVSAAAGSGKTAVLVERIIQKITDQIHPVDIDRLLIVTFTNAAAAEMRERISLAIEKKMAEDPENENLQRQLTLVHNAQITTIDSFCLYVIRNYFHKIDLEPGFRVADEGEMALMKSDVLEAVLEEAYTEQDPEFLRFTDCYSSAKNDSAIQDMVQKMYQFAQSYPWPMKWLDQVSGSYELESLEELEQTDWMHALLSYLQSFGKGLLADMERCLALTQDADGPAMYEPAVQSDVDQLTVLTSASDVKSFGQKLAELNFARLASARKYEGSVEKQEYVKNTRNVVKKAVTDLKDQFFFLPQEELLEKMQQTAPMVRVLTSLAKKFALAFAEKKREKNTIDFNDMEHFALQVLVDPETGLPTETAAEFQQQFEEIMIDEYQDSNYVQETILTAISKERLGQNNIFMVGDVKQSIYRFRLARPELFMDKYDTYSLTDSDRQRIDLHKNYRSRKEIVDSVNDVFYSIMQKDLGNVTYDEKAALYQGASFQEPEEADQFVTEVLLIEREAGDGEDAVSDRFENEARVVAARIRELMRRQKVTDKETGELREIHYSDIVILFRSLSGWADRFVEILSQEGIPAHTESKTGYFSTIEIQTLLNLLRVIDNPKQDIPLTAVLTSPVVGVTGEELAQIRIAYPECPFHEAVQNYYREDPKERQEVLFQKLAQFYQKVEDFQKRAVYLPIHELMEYILRETGYEEYVAALPAGARKEANIRMLVEKAIAYESTSYRGLFHFVRYIEKLQKYDVDFGEAELLGEADDTVRIMSIHKSKGLEFPVVFVCGMEKQFNKQDTRSKLILHPELGVGIDHVDSDRRVRSATLIKKVLAKQTELENLGEELRVLYVALTRAKEKLILTGSRKGAEEKLEDLISKRDLMEEEETMSFFQRTKAASYFDWVLPVYVKNQVRYQIRAIKAEDIKRQEMTESVNYAFLQEQFQIQAGREVPDVYEKLNVRLSYQYPYAEEAAIKSKISVSELKHQAMEQLEEETEESEQWFRYEEMENTVIPSFMQETVKVNMGALRGSAFHRAMECMDFTRIYQGLSHERREEIAQNPPQKKPVLTEEEKKILYHEVKEQLKERLEDGKIPKDMYELLYFGNIVDFFTTPLAMRMSAAAAKGHLKREKPFVMGIPASETNENTSSQELVLIQGIIDGFFIEEDKVIVMDYKTDAVEEAETLKERYQKQLELYTRALERITQLEVSEQILYSTRLKAQISLK